MKGIGLRLITIALTVVISASLAVPAAADTGDVTTLAKTKIKFGGNSENDDWEFNRQADDNQYLLPDADTYFITEQNISWMSDDQLILARNEFFARRGRKFSTKWIQEYFNKQKWYHGKIEEKLFNGNLFNAYETANVNFIAAYEAKRKSKHKHKKTKLRLTGPNEADDAYFDIYERFNGAALSGWDAESMSRLGLQWVSQNEDAVESMGYASRDLDGDGQEEFIVGPMDKKTFGEGAVFALYTVADGSPKRLILSDGNIEYYICDDNLIRREETTDDGRWIISYFQLSDGKLECVESLLMDEEANADKPWYSIAAEVELQGFDTNDGKDDKKKDQDGKDLSGTDSFDLTQIGEDEVSSISIEMMSNISNEEAANLRTAHTGEDPGMIPFSILDD